MPLLIVPIGFSGSGKTTYYKRNCDPNKTIYISKDNLRIKYCHDINDQSQNKKIAILSNKILLKTIEDNIYNDEIIIYYDNINIGIFSTIKKYLNDYPTLKVKILLFMDTLKPQLRMKRIQKDLDNGVVRANTIELIAENYENEIKQFNSNIKSIIKYYSMLEDGNDIIERLKVVKLQDGKVLTLYRK